MKILQHLERYFESLHGCLIYHLIYLPQLQLFTTQLLFPTLVSPAGSLHNSVKPLAASNLKDYKVT